MEIAEKVFKVRGQRSRAQRGQGTIPAEGYPSTYHRLSIVCAVEAYDRQCGDKADSFYYTVVHKKVHPFSFYNKCVKCSPNLIIFGRIIALPMLYTVT